MREEQYQLYHPRKTQDDTGQWQTTWEAAGEVPLCLSYISHDRLSGDLRAKKVTYTALVRQEQVQTGDKLERGNLVLFVQHTVTFGRHGMLYLSEVI